MVPLRARCEAKSVNMLRSTGRERTRPPEHHAATAGGAADRVRPNTCRPFVDMNCESSLGLLRAAVFDDDPFLVGALAGTEVVDDLEIVGVLSDVPLTIGLARPADRKAQRVSSTQSRVNDVTLHVLLQPESPEHRPPAASQLG